MCTTDIHHEEIWLWQEECSLDSHSALWGGKEVQNGAPVLEELPV